MLKAIKLSLALVALLNSSASLATEVSEATLLAADAEQMRIIVDGDARAQSQFMHRNYILNGPSNRVLRKAVLVDMLAQGRMASERFERTIEGISITGNVGVVMGSEIVRPSANSEQGQRYGSQELSRRFTNVFIFEHGKWYFLARQASVVGK